MHNNNKTQRTETDAEPGGEQSPPERQSIPAAGRGNRLKVAILGCTGLVGQQFVRMLHNHPEFEISALISSSRKAGLPYRKASDWALKTKIPEGIAEIPVCYASPLKLRADGIRAVFSALPADIAITTESSLAEQGMAVFSNASAHRFDPGTPIIIPEVNPEHFDLIGNRSSPEEGYIITNSNCAAAGIALVLKPFMDFGLKSVILTTFQAVSGGGREGVSSFDILGNIIPFIKSEEDKIEAETKKILGSCSGTTITPAHLDIHANCSRVPTLNGHLASLVIETNDNPDITEAISTLSNFRGLPQEMRLPTAPDNPIILMEEENRPQPRLDCDSGTPERARGMAVSVGRIRKKGHRISLYLLVHNTIRGAAGSSILNAEYALRTNLISSGRNKTPDSERRP